MDFLKIYNDYSCVETEYLDKNQIYHYTESVVAVKGIASGCFWATDIQDAADDNCEHQVFSQVLEKILEIDSKNMPYVTDHIGTADAQEKFYSDHETYFISTCLDSDSEYMWCNYAKKDGYKIVLNKNSFINSLHFIVRNGDIRNEKKLFKRAKVLYEKKEQEQILEKEYQKLILQKTPFSDVDKMSYILGHIMYIGNFFKGDGIKFEQENEYRILINILAHGNPNIDDLLPVRNFDKSLNKHYVEIKFSPNAIEKIVCASENAKELIENDIKNIDIEVK